MFLLVFGTFGVLLFTWWFLTREVKTKKKNFETLSSIGHVLSQIRIDTKNKKSNIQEDNI